MTLLPEQLGRLAELYPEGGAVILYQNGSTVYANNGSKRFTVNAQGTIVDNPDQESLC